MPIGQAPEWLGAKYKAMNELLISAGPCKELLLVLRSSAHAFWDDDEDDLLLAGFKNKVFTIIESTQQTILHDTPKTSLATSFWAS